MVRSDDWTPLPAVDQFSQLIDGELGQIGQHSQGTGHIAVSAVAHGQLGAVSRGEQQALVVGDKQGCYHGMRACRFFGQVHLRLAGAVQASQVAVEDGHDRDRPLLHTQVFRQSAGVFQAVLR